MGFPSIIINPVRGSRFWHRHPWLYQNEILRRPEGLDDGTIVVLKDKRGRIYGTGMYHSRSQIAVRRYAMGVKALNEELITKRILAAQTHREKTFKERMPEAYRMVFSESDWLPGLIIDRYANCFVIQTLTAAFDQRKDMVVDILKKQFAPECVIERNDSSGRIAEGLEPVTSILHGKLPEDLTITSGGVRFRLNLLEGQKTGLFLDQQSIYAQLAPRFAGRRVLDCFCYHGAFGLFAGKTGAASVTSVDSSEKAIECARANATLNGVEIDFQCENAFDFLKKNSQHGEQYDLIVLDPPSFTKNKFNIGDAHRGYKEIHLRALKMLPVGGLLATYTCSHHIQQKTFLEFVTDAAADAGYSLRLLEYHSQSPDHPVLPEVPETEYLRGYLFEVAAKDAPKPPNSI
ncbi:class I SAM-dependent rRNA methyltransferase [Oscillatoria amoena NRMC-F 0135]|uniref:Class I SAM-dependent rRNA methyltransferase n=1 Tax=Geitlerinema calcuttense NRMC-F 0142 TaxID=2922238 RepID=A0ABT7M2J2_9CYAN|nr:MULTISPECIES: class I SAM-dependent rRNA methyltransferase [Cyanophyceae]MDL5050564.1 class I SAM-dependent rRNA methyltransferase [Oscillatoria amoena NRMC-F 0135]MDL5055579.1 class I SAM-dependent rRNA methyltransferase [Oscillatoria laete-virens NRMC-F 0139]MDL5057855.1 class I SAM-dependent rRNA methyltransferase [Geitlerinema calcuttense NRMC-F 0142]